MRPPKLAKHNSSPGDAPVNALDGIKTGMVVKSEKFHPAAAPKAVAAAGKQRGNRGTTLIDKHLRMPKSAGTERNTLPDEAPTIW